MAYSSLDSLSLIRSQHWRHRYGANAPSRLPSLMGIHRPEFGQPGVPHGAPCTLPRFRLPCIEQFTALLRLNALGAGGWADGNLLALDPVCRDVIGDSLLDTILCTHREHGWSEFVALVTNQRDVTRNRVIHFHFFLRHRSCRRGFPDGGNGVLRDAQPLGYAILRHASIEQS